jgi:hypothetical protein
MDHSELAWVVDMLLTLDVKLRTRQGMAPYPKTSLASEWSRNTSPPDRIRKILDAVK